MRIVGDLIRAILLGLVGFSTPRLLVAIGVPLDVWIADLASWITARKDVISQDQAIWGAMWVGAIALVGAELWWHPLRTLGGWTVRPTADDERVRDQLKVVGTPNFQRDFVEINGEKRISKARATVTLRSDAPLAISYTVNDFKTVIENQTAPHEIPYPSKGPTLLQGEQSTFNADLIELENVKCGPIAGEVHFDISYGIPGREIWRIKRALRFKITFDSATCDIGKQICNVTQNKWDWIV